MPYINLILKMGISKQYGMEPADNLIHVYYSIGKASFWHLKSCTLHKETSSLDTVHHITPPCAGIQHTQNKPGVYAQEWIIHSWSEFIVNLTLHVVDVSYSGPRCVGSHVSVGNAIESYSFPIATLCGRSRRKTYYSSYFKMSLKLRNAEYLKVSGNIIPCKIIFSYQSHLSNDIQDISLLWFPLQKGVIWLQPLSAKYYDSYVYATFIQTSILSILMVTLHVPPCWNDSLETDRMNLYDGPGSSFTQLASMVCSSTFHNVTYKSSLAQLSIFYHKSVALDADNVSPRYISYISQERNTFPNTEHHNIDPSKITPIFFSSSPYNDNTFNQVTVTHEKGLFINIQTSSFMYDSSTENECQMAGILFLSVENILPLGPFCGSQGMNALSNLEFGGVTFGGNTVSIITYMYKGQGPFNYKLLVSASQCEGIINPNNETIYKRHSDPRLPPTMHYVNENQRE
jgi:hypothetical protein